MNNEVATTHSKSTVQTPPHHRASVSPLSLVQTKNLRRELEETIQGEVRFDAGSLALYATDGSNYRQVPIGVVIPKNKEDIIQAVSLCRKYGAPLLSRGGGTSLAGQCCNVAIVVDMSKYYNRILSLDPRTRTARVEPGTVLDHLRNAAEEHHLTFAPDPSTHNHCTLGGMTGNNSCGVHSVMGGKTDDNIIALKILLYDGTQLEVGETSEHELELIIAEGGRRGEIYSRLKSLRDRYATLIRQRFPDIPRRVSGYNLPHLLPEHGFHVARALVGSEGTCVTILEETTRLVPSPPKRSLLVLGYPDVYSAGDHITEVLAAKPIGLEGLDDRLVDDMIKKHIHPQDVRLLPDGAGWLLVEFGGETKAEADSRAHALMERLQKDGHPPSMKLFDNPEQEKTIWKVRESGLGATARVPGAKDTWEGWEDSAVPPERVGDYLRSLRALFNKYHYACALYGHFGQGCIHTRIDFDLVTSEGIRKFRSFLHEAADLVLSYGGSLSGEHGDGQSRAELLPKMFGPELMEAFREFKSIWDPDWKMNPGKIVDAYRVDENLRLGATYNPPQVETHFRFPDDDGSFARATLRCVGIGECRRDHGGTMCPSYRVTREEMHSTRGRAHLLFEMLEGHPLREGWKDEHVHEALDLCLACKGCKSDCPVNVDMATYKAEFLSHYYAGRLRPIHAYSMGLIHRWARLASKAPDIVNFLTHAPITSSILKRLGGIAEERSIPQFAPYTFREWFQHRIPPAKNGHARVILWPDTFNNHFYPQTAIAAVEVLEAFGYHVMIPKQQLCCGRPLYDFGMLGRAKGLLQEVLDVLHPEITAGIPLVGLEPSCLAVFRDEMLNLFPAHEDAKRLSRNTFTMSEFLEKVVQHYELPPLNRTAVIHGHCHQKAIMKMNEERKVLDKLGLDYTILDSGCCGMAGSFGFERDHYDISMKVGEYELLPIVRQAAPSAIIVADGFSCREQIAQSTNRHALHFAEVLHMAMHESTTGVPEIYPEEKYAPPRREKRPFIEKVVLAGATALIFSGILIGSIQKRQRKKRLRYLEEQGRKISAHVSGMYNEVNADVMQGVPPRRKKRFPLRTL